MNNIIIVEGLPCSGKSTTANYLADKLGFKCFDENSGNNPVDYEFDSFIKGSELDNFDKEEQLFIRNNSNKKLDGYLINLNNIDKKIFDKLLKYKIYDFLPWNIESKIMLNKWEEFVNNYDNSKYVFNSVFLQNPMCETMIRFGFDIEVSKKYISKIYEIIKNLNPIVIYLKSDNIKENIESCLDERGDKWLKMVIDYHCDGVYGKKNNLNGFNGYIKCLKERQKREIEILNDIGIDFIIIDNPSNNWDESYSKIINKIKK